MPNEPRTEQVEGLFSKEVAGAILIVEPNPDRQWQLARLATVTGHRVIGTGTIDGAIALLDACPVKVCLLAEELAGADTIGLVERLRRDQTDCRVVIMTPPDDSSSGIRPARFQELDYAVRPTGADAMDALFAAVA